MALLPPLPGSPKVAPQGAPAPEEDPGANSFLKPLSAYGGAQAGPTPRQQARALWAHTPGWQKPLMFINQGINDVGTGIENVLHVPQSVRHALDKPVIPTIEKALGGQPASQQPLSKPVVQALDTQHPWFNYGLRWPTELATSVPLAEAGGQFVGGVTGGLGLQAAEKSPLLLRALSRLPASMATGAIYGVEQPGGRPWVNALLGAGAGPLTEGALHGAVELGGKAGDAIGGLWRGITRSVPEQGELDARVGNYLRSVGAPASVTPRPTPEGVALPTAVHADDPNLLDLQGKERSGQRAVPFHELATQNNAAILRGLQDHLAPNSDPSTVSTVAHDLLQNAQARGRAGVRAAYAPFDELKSGVYLQREPIQSALREAYDGLLPAHREALPAKFAEVMQGTGPLHLSSDVEDLQARLSDLIAEAPPYSPKARALLIARDALNKGLDAAPLAGDVERPPLAYDPAKAPLPKRNMVEPDATQDSILQFLAKHPKGISSVEAEAQGLDPADMRGSAARVGIKRAFRQGGMSFDQAAEALHQAGYPVADAHGNYDPNELLNALDNELRGHPVYSAANTRRVAEFAQDAAQAPGAAPPDLTDLAERAMQAAPERAQAILNGWTDDSPETLARVQRELRDAIAPKGAPEATEVWQRAKAVNRAFRERFPQGTARDTEAQRWLSGWLTSQKDPTAFLKQAFTLPSRARAVLDAMQDDPAEREQMRQLMRNQYVDRLMGQTRGTIPGQAVLNADALTKARATNAALERTILTAPERSMLDVYGQAARDNAKILQRTLGGSSETASLLQHQAGKADELLGSGIVHAAAKVHPVAGALAHMLLPRGAGDAAAEALQSTLTNALLDPGIYNRVMSAQTPESAIVQLLKSAGRGALAAAPRAAAFTVPRGLGPALSGVR